MPRSLEILVVDDHEQSASALIKFLGKDGHIVTGANHPRIALELVHAQIFDLIISDISMPQMDGWELMTKVWAAQPRVRAIALSGLGYANDVEKSAKAGFALHVTKPVDMATIRRAMHGLFREE